MTNREKFVLAWTLSTATVAAYMAGLAIGALETAAVFFAICMASTAILIQYLNPRG